MNLFKRFSNKQLVTAVIITIGICITLVQQINLVRQPFLAVSFLDVGQGDAIYIRTPTGSDLLIDGGPTESVLRELRNVMPFFDKKIDVVIATHPDKDHIAGLAYVFDNYTIGRFIGTTHQADTLFDTTLRTKIAEESLVRQDLAYQGMRIILDEQNKIFLDILFPKTTEDTFQETNDSSIVTRLVFNDSEFLFTGDAPVATEEILIRDYAKKLDADVLQLGHHGSKTSSSDMFLKTVDPDIAVASAGKDNSYGHPAREVVDRVLKNSIQLMTTKDSGTITFLSDGTSIWRK